MGCKDAISGILQGQQGPAKHEVFTLSPDSLDLGISSDYNGLMVGRTSANPPVTKQGTKRPPWGVVLLVIGLLAIPLHFSSQVNTSCQPCEKMVAEQIAARGVRDARVLTVMRRIPRHLFVPPKMQPFAYSDGPLPIGHRQTISQPYIVGFMTAALELRAADRVLEIGTGSGYQAAVLAELVREVYSIEIIEPLAKEAEARLAQLGYRNVRVRCADGYRGWPEAAPFDAIMLTAAPDHIPQPLVDQLAPNGRLILPVGKFFQELVRIRRTSAGLKRETLLPVRFVPMTGESEQAQPQKSQ